MDSGFSLGGSSFFLFLPLFSCFISFLTLRSINVKCQNTAGGSWGGFAKAQFLFADGCECDVSAESTLPCLPLPCITDHRAAPWGRASCLHFSGFARLCCKDQTPQGHSTPCGDVSFTLYSERGNRSSVSGCPIWNADSPRLPQTEKGERAKHSL